MRRWIPLVSLLLILSSHAGAEGTIRVTVDEQSVSAAEIADVVASMPSAFEAVPVKIAGAGIEMTRTRGELGLQVDRERLRSLLLEAHNPESVMRRHLRDSRGATLPLTLPVRLDIETALTALVDLKRRADRDPTDARYNPDTEAVIPEQEGVEVDVWATLDRLQALSTARGDELPLVATSSAPRRRAEELVGIEIRKTLGEFATHYNSTLTARDRTHNLRVAARKIDGLVLLPGEEFDFNEVVGERNQANGFKPATVIAAGELVDGLGGGACQIAGTIHAAAFFAGLEITERRPHSRPSTYIKLGLDAAVSYPDINFRFKNDQPFPVVLRVKVEGGQVTASVLGSAQPYLVTFVRRIESFSAYDERVIETSDLPRGVRVLSQRGVPGFTVKRWRIVRDLALNQATRQPSRDVYPPTRQIWRVGTGGPRPEDYEAPAGDTHNEYRADEYTTMTWGPEVAGIATRRRAGRTGTLGWTTANGMPSAQRPSAAPAPAAPGAEVAPVPAP